LKPGPRYLDKHFLIVLRVESSGSSTNLSPTMLHQWLSAKP
jgi:hypothetical protein